MKKTKSVKGKGLSPEETKKKEQRDREQRDKDKKMIVSLEKERGKGSVEKLEKEKKEKALEREAQEKEIRIKERLEKRRELKEIKDKKSEQIRLDYMDKIKDYKEKFKREWEEKEKPLLQKIANLKNSYENLMKERSVDKFALDKIRREWEIAIDQKHEKLQVLEKRTEKMETDLIMEMMKKREEPMEEYAEAYPYSTSASESEDNRSEIISDLESEGEEVTTEVTIIEQQVMDKDKEYEGINYMKEIIKKVEEASLAGPTSKKIEIEDVEEGGTHDEKEEKEDDILELGNIENCDNLIQTALDIQEEVIEITTSKECRKEVGRLIRKEVRNLIEIVVKQQKSLAYYRAKYEEVNKSKIAGEKKETYADKVKKVGEVEERIRFRSKQRSKYLVSIYPNKEGDYRNTMDELDKHVNIKELKGGIKNVRHIRKGGVIVELEEKEDINKLIKSVNENSEIKENFNAKMTPKRLPQFVIFNVGEDEEDNIKKEMVDKNIEINSEEDFKIKGKYKGRFGTNWIVEMKPAVFKKLIERKKIKIGWMSYDIKENLRPTLCYACGRGGHIASVCRNTKICIKCGDKGHQKKDCKSDEVVCINCMFSNKNRGTRYDTKHFCLDKNCNMYQKECDKLSQNTDYE